MDGNQKRAYKTLMWMMGRIAEEYYGAGDDFDEEGMRRDLEEELDGNDQYAVKVPPKKRK